MEKRKIASLNAELSLLGFGLMRLPVIDGDKSKIDYPKAEVMVDRAIKAGVNYFDTAYGYHERMSQVFAGDTLSKYKRDSYHLATKMPMTDLIQSPDDVKRIFEEQLKKCKTDYFDFYLAHGLSDARRGLLRDKVYGYLSKMKEEGLIRRLGFSYHDDAAVLRGFLKDYKWDFAQIQLNYLDWDIMDAKGVYQALCEYKVPVIIMEPVKGGTLVRLNDETMEVLKKAGSSAASLALRYAASLPNVATVLSGMSEPEQVEENIETFTNFKPINDTERKIIEEAVKVYCKSTTIPCTACRYCMDCPSGVDIPLVLDLYNQFLLTKKRRSFERQYQAMEKSKQADNCTDCKKCVDLCPQKIDIPKYMKEAAAAAVP